MAVVNHALSSKVQLIGAFTPVFAGDRSVWSVGVSYFDPKSNLGFDVYGSNAIWQNLFGGLVAQSGASVGFNVHWLFGLVDKIDTCLNFCGQLAIAR